MDQAGDLSSTQRAIDLLARPARHPGFWAALLLVGLIATFLRRGQTAVPAQRRRLPPQVVTARRILEKILVRLARRGHPRFRAQSLEVYLAGLRDDTELPYGELEGAFACYQETRFGGRPFDDARRGRMERALHDLR